jgi:hypothetical protein
MRRLLGIGLSVIASAPGSSPGESDPGFTGRSPFASWIALSLRSSQ